MSLPSRACDRSPTLAHVGDDVCDFCGADLTLAPSVADSDDPAQLDVLGDLAQEES